MTRYGLQRRLPASLFLLMCSCITSSQRADRMYEAENYEAAADLYAQAIKDGTRDPVIFHNAAKTSMKLGRLPQAERYYSRSLRYGGGPPVARDLAQLYLKTSNYRSAIRVLQYLLNTNTDPQPVYNNLGTALMYAGDVLDAESYLLLAQQLNPKDPIPYINLGLLYDRHYRQPRLAVEFYNCYLQLDRTNQAQLRTVALRIRELTRTEKVPDNQLVACGQIYRRKTVAFKPGDLRKQFSKELAEDAQKAPKDASKDAPKGVPPSDPDTTPASTDNVETRVEPDGSKTLILKPKQESAKAALTHEILRDRARDLIKRRRYKDSLGVLEKVPVDALNAEDAFLMGKAAAGLGDRPRAERLWRQSLKSEPTRHALSALWDLLLKTERKKEALALCTSYENVAALKAEVEECQSIVKTGGYRVPSKP